MKFVKNISLFGLGILVGVLLILFFNRNPFAKIKFINKSDYNIEKIILSDDHLDSKYLIENLRVKDSSIISIFTGGESGGSILVLFDNGDSLKSGYYIESKNEDTYTIINDSILYKHHGYY